MPEVDSPTLADALRRYKYSSLLIVLLFGLLGAGLAKAANGEASATALVGLRDPRGISLVRSAGATATDLTRYTTERATFARSARVIEAAALADGRVSAKDLRTRTSAVPAADGDVVAITVRADSGSRAQSLANEVAKAFESVQLADIQTQATSALDVINRNIASQQAQLAALGNGPAADAQRTAYSQSLATLADRKTDVQVEQSAFNSGVEFIDPARKPASGVNPTDFLRNVLAGLICGAFVAMLVAWLRASHSRVIDRTEVAIAKLQIPLLGEIPAYNARTLAGARNFADLPLVEYEFIASNVSARVAQGVVVVSGVTPGDGATTTVANVAVASARAGLRVAVIDANARDRGLTRMMGWATDKPGVLDVLDRRVLFDDVAEEVQLGGGSVVTVVAAGNNGERSELSSRGRMATLLEGLRARFDLVLLDAPPVLSVADAISLAVHADALVLVVRKGLASVDAERLNHQIEVLSHRTIGFVFTHGETFASASGYGTSESEQRRVRRRS